MDYLNIIDTTQPDYLKPHIIQHFKSLEGEGGNNAVGITTLFLRLNKCNCSCTFCDTSFSIKGNPKWNICRADTEELVDMLMQNYNEDDRKHIHSCSITGGEPLLHMESFPKIFDRLLEAFPEIDQIIIETNGNLLYHNENAIKFLKIAAKYSGKLKLTLSISPKLSGKISYAGKVDDHDLISIYKEVFKNYQEYLSCLVEIQVKFVHSEVLRIQNESLMNIIINEKLVWPRTKILVMPFTPSLKIENFDQVWKESKDAAAKYALQNYLRYSPRIHIDRGME
jgi:organic radical activating enzyme